jgi:hypothetical protein
MSMPSTHTLTCRKCGRQQDFTIWNSLNVSLNPREKDQLIDGALTQFTCEGCGESAQVVYPMLYHDMEKALMVQFDPQGQAPPDEMSVMADAAAAGMMADYRLRLVTSWNELIEKVLIFDAGLDDRVLELFKIVVRTQLQKNEQPFLGPMLFAGIESRDQGPEAIGFVLLADERELAFEVPRAQYDNVAASIHDKLPGPEVESGKWIRVDEDYIRGLTDQL